MSNGILVFIEHRQGVINKSSFEAVAAAQQLGAGLGQEVTAVVFGADATQANEVTGFRLAGVVSAESPRLAEYTPDAYADAFEQVVRARDPQYVIFTHTYLVRDFAPKLAARFGKGLVSDCIRMKAEGGNVVFTRRLFQGKMDADVVARGEGTVFATFQSGAYRGDQAERGEGARRSSLCRSRSARCGCSRRRRSRK